MGFYNFSSPRDKDQEEQIEKVFGSNEISSEEMEGATSIVPLAQKYGTEKNAIKTDEAKIKKRKAALAEQEAELFLLLENIGIESFVTGGHTYYRRVDTYYSINVGKAETALEWVRSAGYGGSIKETVNFQTLTSNIKEFIEGEGEPPTEKDGMNVRVVNRVGVRKK